MIYDCFPFFNELELLEIRLHELGEVVDRFVLVESTRTHSGQPKPLYYHDYQRRFSSWRSRITHVVVDDMPREGGPWSLENHQRESIGRGLAGVDPGDIILVSDVDEIPRAGKVRECCGTPGLQVFQQRLCYCFLNQTTDDPWPGTRMLSYATFLELGGAQAVRHAEGALVPEGGWHFSYMGGVSRVRSKLRAYAHQEYNTQEYVDPRRLGHALQAGVDLFGRDISWKSSPDADLPRYVRDNSRRFRDWIYDGSLFPHPPDPGPERARSVDLYRRVKHLSGDVVALGWPDVGAAVALANACSPEPLWAVDEWPQSATEDPEPVAGTASGDGGGYRRFLRSLRILTSGNVQPAIMNADRFLSSHQHPIKYCLLHPSRHLSGLRATLERALAILLPGGVLCVSPPTPRAAGFARTVEALLPSNERTGDLWWWQRPG
jgi:beta-1,4-mannosyl-glycoprotein beta-1,4-N-acetylglucosaminyltransferase